MESVTTYNESITYVLQPLLAIRVMLNPTAETQVLVDKLKMIRQVKVSRSYCNKSFCTNSRHFILYRVIVILGCIAS